MTRRRLHHRQCHVATRQLAWQRADRGSALGRPELPLADGMLAVQRRVRDPRNEAVHDADVGGKLPMTRERLTELIRAEYLRLVERAWQDAVARGDPDLPPASRSSARRGVTFHAP